MALYVNSKTSKDHHVDDKDFMPHEDVVETTFEEERMKAIAEKSA